MLVVTKIQRGVGFKGNNLGFPTSFSRENTSRTLVDHFRKRGQLRSQLHEGRTMSSYRQQKLEATFKRRGERTGAWRASIATVQMKKKDLTVKSRVRRGEWSAYWGVSIRWNETN